uniref:Ovule protein n=1 Tax=Mesocestoides corti TaxID=53468 RepID=A0A5K3EV30_MESCO
MYETTNSEYGKYKPTVHTMPVEFHQRNATFSKVKLLYLQLPFQRYAGTGNYRNHSLNTAKDPSYVD